MHSKSVYYKDKSLKSKLALIKVCTCLMFTSSFNLITFSSFEHIFSYAVNRSLKLFTQVFISSTFIADISLISDIYKLLHAYFFSSTQFLSSNG